MNKYYKVNVQDTSVYKEYLAMRNEIDRHKWFESERAGKDVGFIWAFMDWTIKFKTKWLKERKSQK